MNSSSPLDDFFIIPLSPMCCDNYTFSPLHTYNLFSVKCYHE
jgi:hypothetical protein